MIRVMGGASADTINTAINQAASQGGGVVQLAAGWYPLAPNEQIIFPAGATGVSLVGEGMYGSKFNVAAGRSTDAVDMTAGNCAHVSIRDIGFQMFGRPTWGSIIHAANHHNLIFERVLLLGPINDGIKIDGGPGQYLATLRDVSIEATQDSYRGLVLGADGSPVTQGIYLFGCKFAQSQYGIWCDFVSGFTVCNSELLQHGYRGFVCYPGPPTRSCEAFQMTGLIVDTCVGTGIYLGSGGGYIDRIVMTNCWSGSNSIGLEIAGAPQGGRVVLTSSMLTENKVTAVMDHGTTSLIMANNIGV